MIADNIQRTEKTLEERGLPADSFFEAEFDDGSVVTEKDVNWSSMSAEVRVGYFGETKTVFLCTLPVATLWVHHGDLRTHVNVLPGGQAYQQVRSEAVLLDGKKQIRVVGRVVGVVKDGEVIEEQFINDTEHEVFGTRK